MVKNIQKGSVRVISKRKGGITSEFNELIFDVDRTNPVLGNQHILKNHLDDDERDRVIAAYEKDFNKDVAANGPMLKEVQRLAEIVRVGKKIALRCWCAPKRCHAEILAKKIAEISGIEFTQPEINAVKIKSQSALF